MKKSNFIIFFLFVIFLLLDFTTSISKNYSNQYNCFSLIWNDRLTKKSWIYLNQEEKKVYRKNSDITEGDYLKMPKNRWDAVYTDAETGQKFGTTNKTNASFKFVTLGYGLSDQNKNVGFDFKILNKNKNAKDSYIFRIMNNSQKENETELGNLREVGFVFDNWPQFWGNENKWTGGEHSFSDNYQIEQLKSLKVKFKFKLVDYNSPLNKAMIKEKWLGSYVTCDLRFNEYDNNGKQINSYLIGLVFSNPLSVDYNNNKKDGILYGSSDPNSQNSQRTILIHGNKNGIREINTINKETFQTVEIDFKPLIYKYFTINKFNKNIITGLDIYSATRGANLTYEIKDLQILGCL